MQIHPREYLYVEKPHAVLLLETTIKYRGTTLKRLIYPMMTLTFSGFPYVSMGLRVYRVYRSPNQHGTPRRVLQRPYIVLVTGRVLSSRKKVLKGFRHLFRGVGVSSKTSSSSLQDGQDHRTQSTFGMPTLLIRPQVKRSLQFTPISFSRKRPREGAQVISMLVPYQGPVWLLLHSTLK